MVHRRSLVQVGWPTQTGLTLRHPKNICCVSAIRYNFEVGLITVMITLKNPRIPELEPIEVEALADTGAVHLCIPEHIRVQLRLEEQDRKEVTLADGTKRMTPYVGPIELRFKNRVGFGGAVVMGDQVLLGAIPMEDMDLVIHPRTKKIDVNPDHPNVGSSLAK